MAMPIALIQGFPMLFLQSICNVHCKRNISNKKLKFFVVKEYPAGLSSDYQTSLVTRHLKEVITHSWDLKGQPTRPVCFRSS